MPLDAAPFGQPVELGQVARELKKLWESSGGTKSRASLVNFAVLCEGEDQLAKNTAIISEFMREHACRAILLARVQEEGAPTVRSFINAHCHVARAGARQICCEQLTFLVNTPSEQIAANTLLANLDSDLPLYLWRQGTLRSETDTTMWGSIDRLLFDSREWSDLAEQFSLLRDVLNHTATRPILCDLNWTRTLHLRQAFAQLLDQPKNLGVLYGVRSLRLRHQPLSRSTALLFVSWIARQLGWELVSTQDITDSQPLILQGKAGDRSFTCTLEAAEGAPIGNLEIDGDAGTLVIRREVDTSFYHSEARLNEGPAITSLLPAGKSDIGTLLDDEMTFGGRHQIYLKALGVLEKLLKG